MTVRNSTSSKPLQHDCTVWRNSSQAAANLYKNGVKLWKKHDLTDIERQLADSKTQSVFTVRLIDGTTLDITNPMFGEESPIWKPRIKFQEYWRLVKDQPDGPPETYHCTYLLSWTNTTARSFRGVVANPSSLFDDNRLAWNESRSCELLRSRFEQISATKKVKRIVCFGLGDICRKPPEWMGRYPASGDHNLEISFVRGAMVQHSIALTLAQICSDIAGYDVQLLAQDPDYTDEAKAILKGNGFSIVGDYGAGGFAKVDDDSVVFSVFVEAPLKQIIADIARPLMIISTGFDTFNDSEKPWMDAESPRTVDMWEEYEEKTSFPISPGDGELMSKMRDVYLYVRKGI
ncbi:hypothetical protein BB8028_0001g03620 [Beauveria bassiana]|uniref:SRR1-like domain-containing protein n=1 Tax=Beauveria bassiana TaxID=176275 RepID=A0A2S7XWX6_BEABA|nr:hypothetical protein BB8028_0001g03620 [Beauveria bassiana]